MNRNKKLYLLLGILVIVCIATVVVIRHEEYKEQIKNSDEVILALTVDLVQSLSWEYESEHLAFHKDGKWLYDDDPAFPVNEKTIAQLLEQFRELRASFIIENVENYAQYGLQKPICTINLETPGRTLSILLGNYSSIDAKRYLSIGDGNVYLVSDDPLDYFDIALSDIIKHDEIPSFSSSNNNVTQIQFAGAQTYGILYVENSSNTYRNDDLYFAQISGKSLPLETSRVKSYLQNISSLKLSDYVTYNATDQDLQTYGLSTPELTVTVNYTAKNEEDAEIFETFVINISLDPKAVITLEEDENDSDDDDETFAYLRIGSSSIIYEIPYSNYKNLIAASYDSLRHNQVFPAEFASIKQIEITLDETNYTFFAESVDDEQVFYYQESEIEIARFKSALESLLSQQFTDELPALKEDISLTFYLDFENNPKIQLDLYRYDGANSLATVNKEPIALINRTSAVELIEAVYAIVLD